MASRAECVTLLEVIHDQVRADWPPPELAAARTLIDAHHVTPARASHLIQAAARDEFWRGKISSAVALLKHYEHVSKLAGIGAPGPIGDAYKPYQPAPDLPPQPYQTYGEGRLSPEGIAQRDRWAAKIDDARRCGLAGPALFRAVLGFDLAGVPIGKGGPRVEPTSMLGEAMAKARELTREARAAEAALGWREEQRDDEPETLSPEALADLADDAIAEREELEGEAA